MSLDLLEEIDALLTKTADSIETRLVVDDEGTMTETESCYAANLPKDLTMETVEKVHEYDSMFASAFALAGGRKAIEHRKAHPNASRVAGVIRTGKNEMAFNYNVPTRKADGTWKDPSVTVISRRFEHKDHSKVRSYIGSKTKEIMD